MLSKKILQPKSTKPSPWRYALLEILIIIVGILLSVAITEWFASIKDTKREAAYLEDLSKDLSSDLESLEYDLAQREDQLAACEQLASAIQAKNLAQPATVRQIVQSLTALVKTTSFNPSVATFRALESTGRMELLENEDIVRNLIQLYTRYYDLVKQNNDDVTNYRNSFLLPFMVDNLNFAAAPRKGPVANLLLVGDRKVIDQLQNHIIYNQQSLSSTIVAYTEAINHLQETLGMVASELE